MVPTIVLLLRLLAALIVQMQPAAASDLSLPMPPVPPGRDLWAPLVAGLEHLTRTARDPQSKVLSRIYRERSFRPIWVTPRTLSKEGLSLVRYLAVAGREGWRTEEHRLSEIHYLNRFAFPEPFVSEPHRLAELEWVLSRAFVAHAETSLEGRRPRARARAEWHLPEHRADIGGILRRVENRGAASVLGDVLRSHERYTSIRRALADYREIERAGGWTKIEDGGTLRLGDSSDRVLALRRRLAMTRDLQSRAESPRFDAALEEAVRRFQRRHGLPPDGCAGPKTIAALNVPVEDRVRTLAINLERRRWLPASLGREFLWVNIPEFRLRLFRDERAVLEMPVVVGSPERPTPRFRGQIEHAVINPYWEVPESIALGELMPRETSEPGYLRRASFELVDRRGDLATWGEVRVEDFETGRYRLRRKPGPRNDLGRIKFMLPNPFHVYLHDTPQRQLFERSSRAFSHGCVRLGRPLDLARHLLPPIFFDEVPESLADAESRVVRLKHPMPIYFVYFTAWRGDDGEVHFRDDIYGQDEALWVELRRERAEGSSSPGASSAGGGAPAQ